MSKPTALSKSPRYRKFVASRDRTLERILFMYQIRNAQVMSQLREHVRALTVDAYRHLDPGPVDQPAHIHHAYYVEHKDRFEQRLGYACRMAASSTIQLIQRMRRTVYTLAHAGEAEAVARALGKRMPVNVSREDLTRISHAESSAGGPLAARIDATYARVRRRIMDAIERAVLLNDTIDEAVDRVLAAMPQPKRIKRPPRELKAVPMREAGKKQRPPEFNEDRWIDVLGEGLDGELTLSQGFIDDEAWQQVVEDYKAAELPSDVIMRGPKDVIVDETNATSYAWEGEQELSHDFVQQVRSGQGDFGEMAKANGITDMLWIAVIDDHTCARCCEWRDGLKSEEIEIQLAGEHADDAEVCDAIVPPAHFNCRCTMAPVTVDFPEETPPDFGEFTDWLNRER